MICKNSIIAESPKLYSSKLLIASFQIGTSRCCLTIVFDCTCRRLFSINNPNICTKNCFSPYYFFRKEKSSLFHWKPNVWLTQSKGAHIQYVENKALHWSFKIYRLTGTRNNFIFYFDLRITKEMERENEKKHTLVEKTPVSQTKYGFAERKTFVLFRSNACFRISWIYQWILKNNVRCSQDICCVVFLSLSRKMRENFPHFSFAFVTNARASFSSNPPAPSCKIKLFLFSTCCKNQNDFFCFFLFFILAVPWLFLK